MMLYPFDTLDPAIIPTFTGLWNAACGQGLAISERLSWFNLGTATRVEAAGCLAMQKGQPVGFTSVSSTTRPINGLHHPSGWIDALAVLPNFQGQGLGSRLLSWAENWLSERSRKTIRLGGGLRPFAPGLPVQLGSAAFFLNRGYSPRPESGRVWDVARGLDNYTTPALVKALPLEIRSLQAGEAGRLDAFLGSEFPGRWHFEYREHLRLGGRLSDYLALWSRQEIEGFCQVTLEDSIRPIERFYPRGLPRPWGQLGPIGVCTIRRGQGMGVALLDAGLRYLQAQGVASCVIDWTDLLAFYQKFGFQPHREYIILIKELG